MREPAGGGAVSAALERVGEGIATVRDPLSVVLALLALAVALRGLEQGARGGVAIGIGLLLIARAVALGRPIVGQHLAGSVLLLLTADWADATGQRGLSWAAVVAGGAVLGLPRRPPMPADVDERRHVWALVDATPHDTIAPFALRADKSYVHTSDRTAAVAYRVRFGTAIASGDPIGDPAGRDEAIDAFFAHADANGWRAAALGISDHSLGGWRRQGLRALAIGRDVVLDVETFSLAGRQLRNLRQAVQRTHNAGVTTDVVVERELSESLRSELETVVRATGKNAQGRGFAMNLDHVLDGTHPGIFIAFARDSAGTVVAFQRYATADGGRELSLDVPWRRPDAPNGVDERLIVDTLIWGAARGAGRLSLSFAAFPNLFELRRRNLVQWAAYCGVSSLDRFIHLESLYRFVRKFHALDQQRYVAFRPMQLGWVALAALSLEFGLGPRRRH